MKKKLAPRVKEIDGVEITLPPDVSWDRTYRCFNVQSFKLGKRSLKRFYPNTLGSVAKALEDASQYALECRAERDKHPPYATIGIDKPIALGKGIYMQTNVDRGNYQLLRVQYGSVGKGNLKKMFIGLGRAGYYPKDRLTVKLRKAQMQLRWWAEEDKRKNAANQPAFVEKKQA